MQHSTDFMPANISWYPEMQAEDQHRICKNSVSCGGQVMPKANFFIWMYTLGQNLYMNVYPGPTPWYECIPCDNSFIWMYTLYQLFDFDAWREPTRWFRWHWFGWYAFLIPRLLLIQMLVEYPAQLHRPLLSTSPLPQNFPLCTPLQWLL